MASGVSRVTDAIEVLVAEAGGASTSFVASALKMSTQTARRMLDSMVGAGLATKDDDSRLYYLTPQFYYWGLHAIAPSLPSPAIQREMAALAESTQDSVYYLLRDRSWILGIERVIWSEHQSSTVPFGRRYHWSESIIGLTLVAFLPPEQIEGLVKAEKATKDATASLRQDLVDIRARGYSERLEGHYLAIAPILDASGYATSVLVVSEMAAPAEEARERIVAQLLEACARCSPSRRINDLNLLD